MVILKPSLQVMSQQQVRKVTWDNLYFTIFTLPVFSAAMNIGNNFDIHFSMKPHT